MKKSFPHISGFILTITLVFVVSGFILPQVVHAVPCESVDRRGNAYPPGCDGVADNFKVSDKAEIYKSNVDSESWWMTKIIQPALAWLVLIILKIVSLLTGLAAVVLNGVIYYTVVKVSENYASLTGIDSAWSTIRDLANMGFIFVLLYAAIQTILGIGSDVKKLIVNVIVVAILINFSLFFTRVVIDISNILALLFYDAIAPGALSATGTLSLEQAGLSNAFMQYLSLQSLYKISEIGIGSIITTGIMGSIMLLIAAFVFFAVAIMFLIRYVVLILVLILSPIAFVSFVLPGLDGKFKEWWNALSGQAFFAPIYFMLTWVALRVLGGVAGQGGITGAIRTSFGVDPTNSALSNLALTEQGVNLAGGAFGMFINFVIVIIFLIVSLIIAKEWSNKAGGAVGGLNKWAMGAAGGAAFGGLGWAGRTTLGRAGTAAAESARLQEAANKERTGAWDRTKGAASRLALYASKKARSGSYDPRSATIPTSALGALVEGTIGRTKAGRALGLHDVPIPSVQVGAFAADQTGVGEGGKKGFIDTREESRKRVHEREAKAADELAQARAERDVKMGARAGASANEIEAMEKALTKLSDKQTETLVANNRELLNSQNFANKISVQQLEALNKSTQFSEAEQDKLNGNRFKNIYSTLDRVAVGGTFAPEEISSIKDLTDKELELFASERLVDKNLVKQLRGAQVEGIVKSTKRTTRQKDEIREIRRQGLVDAVKNNDADATKKALRGLSTKEILTTISKRIKDSSGGELAFNKTVIESYTSQMLSRMASEMSPGDIVRMRDEIEKLPADHKLRKWLNTDKGMEFS